VEELRNDVTDLGAKISLLDDGLVEVKDGLDQVVDQQKGNAISLYLGTFDLSPRLRDAPRG
jgi:hypothetical protein